MVFPVTRIGLFKSSISGCTRSVCNAVGMEYGNGVAVSVPGFLFDLVNQEIKKVCFPGHLSKSYGVRSFDRCLLL